MYLSNHTNGDIQRIGYPWIHRGGRMTDTATLIENVRELGLEQMESKDKQLLSEVADRLEQYQAALQKINHIVYGDSSHIIAMGELSSYLVKLDL
jgi:hypothetical protein